MRSQKSRPLAFALIVCGFGVLIFTLMAAVLQAGAGR